MAINEAGCMKEIGVITKNNPETGEKVFSGNYGLEVMVNCYECDITLFTRKHLRRFFRGLVKLLEMEASDRHYRTEPRGLTAIQFILTSNITVHCVDDLERVYVNIFSCKEFKPYDALEFTREFFKAKRWQHHVIVRT